MLQTSDAWQRYEPEPPPDFENEGEMLRYLHSEYRRLAAFTQSIAEGHFESSTKEPEKPRTGMIRFADGTHWNPGSGRDLYWYDETIPRWNVLLSSPAGSPLGVPDGGTGLSSGTSGGILGFTGPTTLASSGVLGLNQVVLGGGVGATPATPLGLGTSVQTLHGNAAGAPTWGAVNLTTDVTGRLPLANLGGVGSAGQILRSNGTDYAATTATYPDTITAKQLLYAPSANVIQETGAGLTYDPTLTQSGGVGFGVRLMNTSVITSGTERLLDVSPSIIPPSSSSANYSAIYAQPTYSGTQNITGTVFGLNFIAGHAGTGLLSGMRGVDGLVSVSSPAAVGTILTIGYGGNFGIQNSSTGTVAQAVAVNGGNGGTGAITTSIALSAAGPTGTGSISGSHGVNVNNMGRAGVSNAYGITVQSQTGASARNTGIGIADVGTGASNRANLVLGATLASTAGSWSIQNLSTFNNYHVGNSFFGAASTPGARVELAAGTATAGTGPLKFNSGTSLTTPVAGVMEFTTDDLFFTIATGTARKRLAMADPVGGLTSGRVPYNTTNGRLTDVSTFVYDSANARLGIGTVSPASPLEVRKAGGTTFGVPDQLRVSSGVSGDRAEVHLTDGVTSDAFISFLPSATGATRNIELSCNGAGSGLKIFGDGVLGFGTHTAIGAETVTGFITAKDNGGTTRKLAVVS